MFAAFARRQHAAGVAAAGTRARPLGEVPWSDLPDVGRQNANEPASGLLRTGLGDGGPCPGRDRAYKQKSQTLYEVEMRVRQAGLDAGIFCGSESATHAYSDLLYRREIPYSIQIGSKRVDFSISTFSVGVRCMTWCPSTQYWHLCMGINDAKTALTVVPMPDSSLVVMPTCAALSLGMILTTDVTGLGGHTTVISAADRMTRGALTRRAEASGGSGCSPSTRRIAAAAPTTACSTSTSDGRRQQGDAGAHGSS